MEDNKITDSRLEQYRAAVAEYAIRRVPAGEATEEITNTGRDTRTSAPLRETGADILNYCYLHLALKMIQRARRDAAKGDPEAAEWMETVGVHWLDAIGDGTFQ